MLLSIVAQVREEFEETGATSAKTAPANTATKTEWILAILKQRLQSLSVNASGTGEERKVFGLRACSSIC